MFIDEDVPIPLDGVRLDARLSMPTRRSGVVVFAHDGGPHPRGDLHVARTLQREHLATVLVDLRPAGDRPADVPVLAGRLAAVVDWLADQPATSGHPIGLFGAGGGAAVALLAAAERPVAVRAVVCRDGRVDLAGDALTRVLAPTLLIVGEQDEDGAALNREAVRRLRSTGRLEVVPGADHPAEEPGALDRVTRLTARWFHRHVGTAPAMPPAP
ncbi:dienelactone hydrolase family protein [Actinosynnema sp. NPDC002837]